MNKILTGTFVVAWLALFGVSPAYAYESVHVVQAEDSLVGISAQYGISVEEIMLMNNLIDSKLSIGQELQVGDYNFGHASKDNQEQEFITDAIPLAVDSDEVMFIEYTVQEGDTLRSIAYQHGITIQRLKILNNLQNDVIYLGNVLKVPNSSESNNPSRSGSQTAFRLLEMADKHIGTPYKYGGSSPGGFDCSGFAGYMYSQIGIELPRTAASQYSVGVSVTFEELAPGDLVFFKQGRGIDHVGIYVGDNQFIHSSSARSGGVIYSSLIQGYYSNYYVGARRVIR